MRSPRTSLLLLLLLTLIGCNSGSRPSTSPELPAVQDPASTIPRSIGTDPPGGGPVVPPAPDPDAPAILDVTVSRSPLPANAWAELHAVSNVSLVSHEWHLGSNAVMRSYSTFASLPIKTLQPGLQRGWVEGRDAKGRRAMREFDLEIADTPNVLIGWQLSREIVAVGDEFDVRAIVEGPNPQIRWRFESDRLERTDYEGGLTPQTIRLRALRPGRTTIQLKELKAANDAGEKTADLRVMGTPELIHQHTGSVMLGPAGAKAEMRWLAYGDTDSYEWAYGTGATQLPYGPLIHYLQLDEAGMHFVQARAHNNDGWSQLRSYPYAVGRTWSALGDLGGRHGPGLTLIQDTIWKASKSGNGPNKPPDLWIGSTTAAYDPSDVYTFEGIRLPWPAAGGSKVLAVQNCGRPVFFIRGEEHSYLVMSRSETPESQEDWVIREIAPTTGFRVSEIAGSEGRLATLSYWNRGTKPSVYQLAEIRFSDFLQTEAPLNLTPLSDFEVSSSNGVVPLAMPEGVAVMWSVEDENLRHVVAISGGQKHEYELTLTEPAGEISLHDELTQAGQEYFLSSIDFGWMSRFFPERVPPRVLLRSGSTLPLSPVDWETVELPPHLHHSRGALQSYPGEPFLWIGDFGIDISRNASAFSQPSSWIPVSPTVAGLTFHPEYVHAGRLFGWCSPETEWETRIWCVSLE